MRIFARALAFLLMSAAPAAADITFPLAGLVKPGSSQAVDFQVPLLGRAPGQTATLQVVFAKAGQEWADAMRSGKSLVLLDGSRVVDGIRLDPDKWAYEVHIPDGMPGHHMRLALLNENSTCAPDSLPDMIDTSASRMTVRQGDGGMLLSSVPDIIRSAFPAGKPLTIWSPHGLSGDDRLSAALSVVQGFSLADLDRIPDFRIEKLRSGSSNGSFPGIDADAFVGPADVIIGTVSELEGFVSEDILGGIKGPYIGIHQVQGAEFRTVILISGLRRPDLAIAAKAFRNPNFEWPAVPAVLLGEDGRTDADMPMAAAVWGPDRSEGSDVTYTFAALGYPTADGMRTVRIPVMQLSDPGSSASSIEIRPDFVYGPGYAKGSALNVYLGGRFFQSIPVNPEGGNTADQIVTIPVSELPRGVGEITIKPHLIPSDTGSCMATPPEVPSTLRGSGTVKAPWLGGARIRPSLANIVADGRLNPASERNVEIVAESSEDNTVAAALQIAGKLVQSAKAPLPGMRLTTETPHDRDADVVLIGTHQWAATELGGVAIKKSSLSGYPDWVQDGAREAGKLFGDGSAQDKVLARLASLDGVENDTVAFGWFDGNGRTVVGMAFPNEDVMASAADTLVEKRNWDRLAGDVILLTQDTPMQPEFIVGNSRIVTSAMSNPMSTAREWLNMAAAFSPGYFALPVGFVLLVASLLMWVFVRSVNRRVAAAEGPQNNADNT